MLRKGTKLKNVSKMMILVAIATLAFGGFALGQQPAWTPEKVAPAPVITEIKNTPPPVPTDAAAQTTQKEKVEETKAPAIQTGTPGATTDTGSTAKDSENQPLNGKTQGAPQQDSGWTMILWLVLMFGIFYFLLIRPQKKDKERRETMVSRMEKGDMIITSSGVYGELVTSDDKRGTIDLMVDKKNKVVMTFSKSVVYANETEIERAHRAAEQKKK